MCKICFDLFERTVAAGENCFCGALFCTLGLQTSFQREEAENSPCEAFGIIAGDWLPEHILGQQHVGISHWVFRWVLRVCFSSLAEGDHYSPPDTSDCFIG